jgi:hypothetical protein
MSTRSLPLLLAVVFLVPTFARSQSASEPPPPNEISADLGYCSAAFTVTGIDSKPVYGAKIATRVQYGLMGVKRLDLEAYTGPDGHVKITHLPLVLKKPMYIHITKGDKEQIVEFHPDRACESHFDVILH